MGRLRLLCLCLCLYLGHAQESTVSDLYDNQLTTANGKARLITEYRYQENHKPMFEDCVSYSPSVKEDQPVSTYVTKVTAKDPDDPSTDAGRITYSLVKPAGARSNFFIDNVTGVVTTAMVFDRDEPTRQQELYLTVKATDQGQPPLADVCTFKVTVMDINDNIPSFDLPRYAQEVSDDLPENSEVLRVVAYDSDEGENSRLTYSFGDPFANINEYFKIDPSTGVIHLKKKLTGKRDTKFSSTVVVHDNGVPQQSAQVDISFSVVDSDKRPPTIKLADGFESTIKIKENEHDFERVLFKFVAESNSKDGSVAFELIKGKTTQTNKDQTFLLSPVGNASAVIKLGRTLDYETVPAYQLTIRAKNKDRLDSFMDIKVEVEDVNDEVPYFIEDNIAGSVVENDIPGAQAMRVSANDKDGTSPNNKVEYVLLSYQDKFTIDTDTGVITAKVVFDRETETAYHVVVQAHDCAPSALYSSSQPNSQNSTFVIYIEDQNDNSPKFIDSYYQAYVSESEEIGRTVIDVKANDSDIASHITYSIIEGNDDNSFIIEETTGRIKVNKKLDYEKIEEYNLTVKADDGLFNDTAKVHIVIKNENDEIPIFNEYNKNVTVQEETVSDTCIITLTAYDPDIKDRSADQKIVYRVVVDHKSFLSVDENGCVRLIKPLDRDPPNGSPSYQGFVQACDNNGGPNELCNTAEITIFLEDINDNAPVLNQTEVVYYENQDPGVVLVLTAIDNDGPNNGPPFTYNIPSHAPEMLEKFRIEGGTLLALVRFDREEKKFYDLPIEITDSGSPPKSGISILRVIIGDVNDNKAMDGSSEIFVNLLDSFTNNIKIGRVYVEDPDDWDLPDKVFQLEEPPTSFDFSLGEGGMIIMQPKIEPGVYNLTFKVIERFKGEDNMVHARVTVHVKPIPIEAVYKSGSIRLTGITAEEFVEVNPRTQRSKKDELQRYIAQKLNTSIDNVDVLTVLVSPHNKSFIDVRFSAHGSPYYPSLKLNNIVLENKEDLEGILGTEFFMIGIDECIHTDPCPGLYCSNSLAIGNEPASVFTNKTSFVGVNSTAEANCIQPDSECEKPVITGCFNGGTLLEETKCDCPEGFEGPNCERLDINFGVEDSWYQADVSNSCDVNFISISVTPQNEDGVILYAGPQTVWQAKLKNDYISLELKGGKVVFKIGVNGTVTEVVSKSKPINDGSMHKIRVRYTKTDVQLDVDDCPRSSECLTWIDFEKSGPLRLIGPLQIGGRWNIFSKEEAKQQWNIQPSSRGFIGCITNFTFNNRIYDFSAPSVSHNVLKDSTCAYGTQAAAFRFDSDFLIVILVCLSILLLLMLAVVVHKRQQASLNEKEMDDTRENIINYEDEGGGEGDANFDLSVFPHGDEKPPMHDTLYRQANDVPADIGTFLDDKKRACDKDALPYDDVRHYAYEGDGNSTGSLSSLASCTDDGDLKFNYLSNFGPRFRKLADMYGDDASEEGSQTEESWC